MEGLSRPDRSGSKSSRILPTLQRGASTLGVTIGLPASGLSGRSDRETAQVVEVGHREKDRGTHRRVGASGVKACGNMDNSFHELPTIPQSDDDE